MFSKLTSPDNRNPFQTKQTFNIVMITFWSQFAAYGLNTILILFLTDSVLKHGLGYDQAKAYAFMGVSQATGYLMPLLGGYMADQVLGLRRSILLGSILLVFVYLMIMLSGLSINQYGDRLFLAAYALTPAAGSLLMGTASALVSSIFRNDEVKAKSAMTYYYMAINVGALLATLIAPSLLDSPYGPLSVLAVCFVGKAIAALNFAAKYKLYDNVVLEKDKNKLSQKSWVVTALYLLLLYILTFLAFSYVKIASVFISLGCLAGMTWFLIKTLQLSGTSRLKQSIALVLIFEAVIFFITYNQMNSTLILFAKFNAHNQFWGWQLSPAHYQLLNPLLILMLGLNLPAFYRKFPKFSIPYQFAAGTLLASLALLLLGYAPAGADGMVSGSYVALAYVLITLAELWVSAIGLSMIGLYCDVNALGFAMGAWYLASSLSNLCSGYVAQWAALPQHPITPLDSLLIYQTYYDHLGWMVFGLGMIMVFIAFGLHRYTSRRELILV